MTMEVLRRHLQHNAQVTAAETLTQHGIVPTQASKEFLKELLNDLVEPGTTILAARARFEETEDRDLFDALLRTVNPDMANQYLPAQTWITQSLWQGFSKFLPRP